MTPSKYQLIVDDIADDIRSKKLPPGFQLPTHRQLAAEHKIAKATATKVYTRLEQLGLISSEAGRGTFVRETALSLNNGIDQSPIGEGTIDLNFNSPSLPEQTQLLRNTLKQLAHSGDLDALLHYQPHAGRIHERAIIANHLEYRGLSVSAEQVLIVSGAQHGLACTVLSTLNPGDVVLIDALTYPGFKILAQMHKLELVPIPCSDNGPDLEALAEICSVRKVSALYCMPTMHNPLGWVLTLNQRLQIISIAQQHNVLIIEDAAYAYLADDPPPPIAALAPQITIYVSGLSKSIATGLRVGFIAAPMLWVSKIERTIRATTWNTPALMTAIVCGWIQDKTVLKLEQVKREDAQQRQLIARKILQGLSYITHPNSYFIWLPLPEEVRADKIVMDLLNNNISVSNAEPFTTTEHVPHAIRIALGSVTLATLENALRTVKKCIDTHAYL